MRVFTSLGTVLAGGVLLASLIGAQEPLSKFDREIALQMLKYIREDLQKQYYDPGYRGIDLAGRFADAEATVRASTSANQVSKILSDFVDQLNDSHTAVSALNTLVSLTFDRPVTVINERRRTTSESDVVKPANGPFTGRIIALVDSESASAAEIYARVLQIEKRGTVVGDRTAGAVMMSRWFPHQVGIGRYTSFATSITVADLRMSDGSSLETAGVTPDERALPTGADLAADSDPVLSRAVELAGGTLTPAVAGKIFAEPR